jgi:hypothetical protein
MRREEERENIAKWVVHIRQSKLILLVLYVVYIYTQSLYIHTLNLERCP